MSTAQRTVSAHEQQIRRAAFEVLNVVSSALLVTAVLVVAMVPVGYWLSGLVAQEAVWPIGLALVVVPLVGAAFSLSFGAARVYPEDLRADSSR